MTIVSKNSLPNSVIVRAVENARNMATFSIEENILRSFCQRNKIPEFVILKKKASREYDEFTGTKIYFSDELLALKIARTFCWSPLA